MMFSKSNRVPANSPSAPKMHQLEESFQRLRRILRCVRLKAARTIVVECIIFAFAYDALMPDSMYFSPDSVTYLSGSSVVPPVFSLLARTLVTAELGLGAEHVVLLRYISIFLYSLGGWLIARALIRAGRPILACLVVPTLWSANSLIYWFNYLLTEGIVTALLIICLGAYANLQVSLTMKPPGRPRSWLILFIGAGMVAFSLRPAFMFVAPVMILMLLSRGVFSRRRFLAGSIGVVSSVVAINLFTVLWHGKLPQQSGGVLTALVFDLPLPPSIDEEADATTTLHVQQALEPFIKKYRDLGSDSDRFLYKALNNIDVVRPAILAAVGNHDSNHILTEEDVVGANPVLTRIAVRKIKHNPGAYFTLVVKNSYYAMKQWGDWYRNDYLGPRGAPSEALQGTKAVAPLLRSKARIEFDPTILSPIPERWYTDYLFQAQKLLLSGHVIHDYTPIFFALVLLAWVPPFVLRPSIEATILFGCCILGVTGLLFQNAAFPVIPRLLAPLHPLWSLGALMLLGIVADKGIVVLRLVWRKPAQKWTQLDQHGMAVH